MTEIVNWVRGIREKESNYSKNSEKINIGELVIQVNIQNNYNTNIFDQRSIINNFNPNNIFYAESSEGKSYYDKETSKTELIKTDLDYETVLKYFLQLSDENDPNSPYPITNQDIINLVQSNFYFKNKIGSTTKKLLKTKFKKQIIIQFIYDFYNRIDLNRFKRRKDQYIKFLIENFSEFQNDNPESLNTNFSKKATGIYPFKINN
jgi:hypothetical protein